MSGDGVRVALRPSHCSASPWEDDLSVLHTQLGCVTAGTGREVRDFYEEVATR